MKTDDIKNKNETNQYSVKIFHGVYLETQGTSKDQPFFHSSKGE